MMIARSRAPHDLEGAAGYERKHASHAHLAKTADADQGLQPRVSAGYVDSKKKAIRGCVVAGANVALVGPRHFVRYARCSASVLELGGLAHDRPPLEEEELERLVRVPPSADRVSIDIDEHPRRARSATRMVGQVGLARAGRPLNHAINIGDRNELS